MKVLGIGNAIVDVICKVEESFLSKNNLTKGAMKLVDESEFKKLLIRHTRKFIFCDDVKSIKILLSKLKVDTGVIGAAAIFR